MTIYVIESKGKKIIALSLHCYGLLPLHYILKRRLLVV